MKHKVSSTTSALAHEIAALRQATPADLKERWRSLYRTEPPRRISRDLLVRALAYRIQERVSVGFSPPRADCWRGWPPTPQPTDLSRLHPNPTSSREQSCCASGTAPSIR